MPIHAHRKHGDYTYEVENHAEHGMTTFYVTTQGIRRVIGMERTDNPDRVCLALFEAEKAFNKLPTPADRWAFRQSMVALLNR
jgi:hypothetical protein